MWNPRILLFTLFAVLLSAAQPAPPPPMKPPVLLPGEGFAISRGDGDFNAYGEAEKEAPMGSLAKLVWMRLEGSEWASRNVKYRCKGTDGAFTCWNREGHGRMDLGWALRDSCNLAFLCWIGESQARWKTEYGEAVARVRMEDVFAPFLGRRLPPGDTLPPLTAAWVGDGDLLRTSPAGFLRWLLEPDKEEVAVFGRRFLAGSMVEFNDLVGKQNWWFKTGTAPVPGEPTATSAWVAGGLGSTLVVLHLPRGRGKQEGLVRIREILGLKG